MDKKKGSSKFLDRFLEESSFSQTEVASDEYDSHSWIKEKNMSLHEQEQKRRLRGSK